jgi:GGDEF domain-containing protein
MTTPPAKDARSAPNLSIAQMLGVMRVEFHRARTQRVPLCTLMVAVDGLQTIFETHRWPGKDAAMRAAYGMLKACSKELGFFGMALMSGDRIMALFPNTEPARVSELGSRMVERARKTPLTFDGETIPLTLSLGAAHNLLAETNSSFEGLVEMAGRALFMATEGSGDRYVMWREAEAEIDSLRQALEARKRSFAAEEQTLEDEASEIGGLQQAELVDKIQRIFATVTMTSEIESLQTQIVDLAVKELYEERRKAVAAQMAEHRRQTDQLEKRIAKLTSILGVTEEELKRVMAMKNIDAGVASIFRTVQGLTAEDAQAETKKALMSEIFKQNVSFQKRAETADAQNTNAQKAEPQAA